MDEERARQTPEERAERLAFERLSWWQRFRRAHRAPDRCARCGRKLGRFEAVYLDELQSSPKVVRGYVCESCTPPDKREWLKKVVQGV